MNGAQRHLHWLLPWLVKPGLALRLQHQPHLQPTPQPHQGRIHHSNVRTRKAQRRTRRRRNAESRRWGRTGLKSWNKLGQSVILGSPPCVFYDRGVRLFLLERAVRSCLSLIINHFRRLCARGSKTIYFHLELPTSAPTDEISGSVSSVGCFTRRLLRTRAPYAQTTHPQQLSHEQVSLCRHCAKETSNKKELPYAKFITAVRAKLEIPSSCACGAGGGGGTLPVGPS